VEMKEEPEKYLLKSPEAYIVDVMKELNNRHAILELGPRKECDGVFICEVIFSCPKMSGFEEWLKKVTEGNGSVTALY